MVWLEHAAPERGSWRLYSTHGSAVSNISQVSFLKKPPPTELNSDSHIDKGSIHKKMGLLMLLAAGAGAAGTVAAAPVVLATVGFTSAGIAAGSYAASMMSAAAVANGGGVAAGSLVAVLQAAGAAGIPVVGQAVVGAAGATVTTVLAILF
ncbi:interferon alpha-inducible protein 27-like protein 2A [Megalobrama amblycephala]|uniref:interferon alpha-inducible protein 27-like protein 2A n=1 Tax=Megalobrama amblycephala TaxID=75352 RepID=UPI002014149C|nr:interferon alpha-inducible protein 27-like protein 2A [Megalobrama amblycephala]